MADRPRMYFQSHECAGYSAKVTIEWSVPDDLSVEASNTATARADEIADDLISKLGPATYEMVQAMRSKSP